MQKLLLFLLLLSSTNSFSCSCGPLVKITNAEIENVGEAFIGRIISLKEIDSNNTIIATFEATKYLKGKAHSSELTVITSSSGASCGLNFEVGQKWFVFSHYSDKQLYATLCGRSVQLSKVSTKAKRLIIGRKNYRKKKKRVRQDKKAIVKYCV